MTKEEVILRLRLVGAVCDRPNVFDLAADMLLGLSEQQEATRERQDTTTI